MNLFGYVRPNTVAEALAQSSEKGSVFLAGGTNLLDLMKCGAVHPRHVVDISRMPGLDRIEFGTDGSVRIGALVRNSDLAHHPEIERRFPSVAEALLSGASPQLRNSATVGGNIMQRTRCAYFFDPESRCNKRSPGAGCDAVGGDTRHAAVLGWSPHCIATHPSDFCVALAALDAALELTSPSGTREVRLEDFHLLPGDTPEKETVLQSGELITAVRLPSHASSFANHARYLKIRDRTSYAFAIVSVAAALRFADGKIAEARLALGGVALKPWRAREAEGFLAGNKADADAFVRAAEMALGEAKPCGDNAFKIELARRLFVRALQQAAQGTPRPLPALPGSVVNLA
jgi:xanthine dehydrogenase YagS FAD-binding subunit